MMTTRTAGFARPVIAGALAAATTVALALPAAAPAYYGLGATVLSSSLARQELADDASLAVDVSADGTYAVFQTRARNFFADDDPDPDGKYRAGGIFRRSIATGALQLVAHGDLYDETDDSFLRRGAGTPSISGNGRYVAFVTAEQLVAADTNDNIDVYVRDMDVAIDQPTAYDLVSARSGGSTPASWSTTGGIAGARPGADLTPAVAISDDGNDVLFSTRAASDLPAQAGTTTPDGQLFLRDRTAQTTTLVTKSTAGGTPAGGGTGSATLSADGSTVAWIGQNAPQQVSFLPGEFADDNAFFYLWRRVADGGSAATRRITGAVDLDDPACAPGTLVQNDPALTGPCYGPLTSPERGQSDISNQTLGLSADGRTVAFVTGAGPRPNIFTGPGFDAWVTSMATGVSRKIGSTELTREGSNDAQASPQIDSVALTADGNQVLLATLRVKFVLPGYTLTGTPRTQPTARELYVLDRTTKKIERIVKSSSGGEIDSNIGTQDAISADGKVIVFLSTATNLFAGDANARQDAFAVVRQPEPVVKPPSKPDGNKPPSEVPDPPETRTLTVRVTKDGPGRLKLRVTAPTAGELEIAARGKVSENGRTRTRTVAKLTKTIKRKGTFTYRLTLDRRTRRALRKGGKVTAKGTITLTPDDGGDDLRRRVTLPFPPVKVKGR